MDCTHQESKDGHNEYECVCGQLAQACNIHCLRRGGRCMHVNNSATNVYHALPENSHVASYPTIKGVRTFPRQRRITVTRTKYTRLTSRRLNFSPPLAADSTEDANPSNPPPEEAPATLLARFSSIPSMSPCRKALSNSTVHEMLIKGK